MHRKHTRLNNSFNSSFDTFLLFDINNLEKKKDLFQDSNYSFYKESKINLDPAEVQISFNDLLILKGIGNRFN